MTVQTAVGDGGFFSLKGSVQGELGMTIVFPGLRCDMVPVVASIGSKGLLGTCNLVCLINLALMEITIR